MKGTRSFWQGGTTGVYWRVLEGVVALLLPLLLLLLLLLLLVPKQLPPLMSLHLLLLPLTLLLLLPPPLPSHAREGAVGVPRWTPWSPPSCAV